MGPSDLELCTAAASGDQAAFHTLVDRHAPALFRVALSLSGSRPDAEDICQDTFVAAFRGLKGFDGRSSVKTWLMRILIRRSARTWQKRRRGGRTVSLPGEDNGCGFKDAGGALTGRLSVPSATRTIDCRLDVRQVIRSLAPEFRDVIILREIDGMSYQEIAAVLGVPCGTVESRLYRARAELRTRLSGYVTER